MEFPCPAPLSLFDFGTGLSPAERRVGICRIDFNEDPLARVGLSLFVASLLTSIWKEEQ
jgi:hypothetical protein